MSLPPPSEHFQGKSVAEHLREARERGAMASAEIHGTEMSGSRAAFCDGVKEMAIALGVLWVIVPTWEIMLLFAAGWIVWKTGRSALLGWSRMERMHRLIEEERWEIEHQRAQEREELTEMYRAKGLEGELLEGVIETLMADDNRLLRVMLEEELGLQLETTEHPLKQALGALGGTVLAALVCLCGFEFAPSFGLPSVAAILIFFASLFAIRLERNSVMHLLTWNLALAGVSLAAVYFLRNLL